MEDKKNINVVAYWNGIVEISSNDIEILDELSRYLYNTYTGFINHTTFNRAEKSMEYGTKGTTFRRFSLGAWKERLHSIGHTAVH